jgi:hypothetical protein
LNRSLVDSTAHASFSSAEKCESQFANSNELLDELHIALDGGHEVLEARFFFAMGRMFEAKEVLRETEVLPVAHGVIHDLAVGLIDGPRAVALAPPLLVEFIDDHVCNVQENAGERALDGEELFLDELLGRVESRPFLENTVDPIW